MILGRNRSLWKHIVLLGIMGSMFLFPEILAESAESGYLQIEYIGKTVENKNIPLDGVEFQLYHVGDMNNGKWSIDAELEQANVSLNEQKTSKVSEEAESLYSYIKNSHIKGKTARTDQNGRAVFDHLPKGLYLVAQSTEWTKPKIGTYQSKPYFVSIPMIADGNTTWEVISKPKSEWEQEDMMPPKTPDQESDQKPSKHSGTQTGDQSQIQVWIHLIGFCLGIFLLAAYWKTASEQQ